MRLTVVINILLIILSTTLMGGKAVSRQPKIEEVNVVQMQQEIVTMWNTWYENQDSWTQNELKEQKKGWPVRATQLAETIKKYQYTPVKIYNWKNKTTTLPIGKDAHLIAGTMAIFESKVTNELVGALGEIGILQCHPRWCLIRNEELKKIPRKDRQAYAQDNPSLNIDAAIKHLTVSYGICNKKVKNLNDWAYPVAHYGAATKAMENGRCANREFAKARVYSMKKYRKKIRENNKKNI